MAKPSVTLRASKGSALTYSELDQNFTNLKDATVSLTAGSGGTQVTSDLNGNITLVAGTGISLSGDNTAKTVTITGGSTELVNDTTPELGGNLDTNGFEINNTNGSGLPVVIYGNTTSANGALLTLYQGGNAYAKLQVPGSGKILMEGLVKFETTSGTPTNTTTPATWLKVELGPSEPGTIYWIPLYS